MGNLNLSGAARFRYGIFDNATLPSIRIGGTAILGGELVLYVFDGSPVTSSDTFTVLTASEIRRQFTNVVSGGRVTAISPAGVPLGTFLVTISNTSVLVSDFQPMP